MKILTTNDLITKSERAASSSLLREHTLLHSNHSEKVQRLIISMAKGSYVAPHYHDYPGASWEMFVVLNGVVLFTLYEVDGAIANQRALGDKQEARAIVVNRGEIHSVSCISDFASLLEVKEGPFDPEFAKFFPNWSS